MLQSCSVYPPVEMLQCCHCGAWPRRSAAPPKLGHRPCRLDEGGRALEFVKIKSASMRRERRCVRACTVHSAQRRVLMSTTSDESTCLPSLRVGSADSLGPGWNPGWLYGVAATVWYGGNWAQGAGPAAAARSSERTNGKWWAISLLTYVEDPLRCPYVALPPCELRAAIRIRTMVISVYPYPPYPSFASFCLRHPTLGGASPLRLGPPVSSPPASSAAPLSPWPSS